MLAEGRYSDEMRKMALWSTDVLLFQERSAKMGYSDDINYDDETETTPVPEQASLPYGPATPDVMMRELSKKTTVLVLTSVAVLVAAIFGILIAVHVNSVANANKPSAAVCAATGTDCPATPTTAVVGIPNSMGMTVSMLNSDTKTQLTEAQPTGFGVTGVVSVSCNPPSNWTPGATFTCFVYGAKNNGLGQLNSTVEESSSDGPNWNADWVPAGY
jgi:hypothetical protein